MRLQEAEFDFSRALGLQRGVYKRDQLARFFEDFVEPCESIRWEIGETIEGGDQVVVHVSADFWGRQGIEVRASLWQVWTIRDGLAMNDETPDQRRR